MILVLMGVSGSGKTVIGGLVAAELGWRFVDADDLHSPDSIARMASGAPLSDEERRPWLEGIIAALRGEEHAVLACSALRRSFRARLRESLPGVRFVHLRGGKELIAARLRERAGHFMPPALLSSQFEALELPEDALVVDVDDAPAAVAARIVAAVRAA